MASDDVTFRSPETFRTIFTLDGATFVVAVADSDKPAEAAARDVFICHLADFYLAVGASNARRHPMLPVSPKANHRKPRR